MAPGTLRPTRPSKPSMKPRLLLLAVVASLATVACVRVETPSQDGFASGMSVVGIGRVEVRPDTLVVALGVESTAPTAPEALEAMTAAADAMIKAIRGAGVAEEDLQTVSLSVREVRTPGGGPVPIDSLPVEGVAPETISIQGSPAPGFVGEQRLRVRILDLESGGEVIEAAVAAAGPDARVFNMSLDIAEPDAAIAQARQQAVEDALERADALAESAGIDLGSPIAIEEISSPDPGFGLDLDFEQGAAGAGFGGATATADAAAKIEPGVSRLEVQILVRFAIEE